MQAHVVGVNVTISFTSTPTVGQSVKGSSVGLVLNGTEKSDVFVINDNDLELNVLLLLQTYDDSGMKF